MFKYIVKRLRHIGIPVKLMEASCELYESFGYTGAGSGEALIGGRAIKWVKLTDGFQVIELLEGEGAEHHLAFGVEAIDESQYYYVTPEGFRVQFVRDPRGNLLEMVEETL